MCATLHDQPGNGFVVRVSEDCAVGADEVVAGLQRLQQVVGHVCPASVVAELEGIYLQWQRNPAMRSERLECRHRHSRVHTRAQQERDAAMFQQDSDARTVGRCMVNRRELAGQRFQVRRTAGGSLVPWSAAPAADRSR